MSVSAASASGMQQAQIGAQVATAIASKSMSVVRDQGEAAVSLLEDAADLQREIVADGQAHKGRLLDVRA